MLSRTQGNKGGGFTFHRLGDLMCSDSSAWSLVLEQFLAQKCAAKCCQQQTVRQFVTILEQCFCHAFVNLLVQYLPKISSIDNTPRTPPVPSGIKKLIFFVFWSPEKSISTATWYYGHCLILARKFSRDS